MAADYNLNITKGSSFTIRLVAQDTNGNIIDLTNWNLRGYAKIKYSESTLLVDLAPQKVAPFTNGFVDINLSAAATATLPVTEGVYDIEMYDNGGYVDKLIRGYVRVYPEVTY
tara:strand:+ start:2529 stop:2867 length:339 start_codon:yes stop_codon:yes gene_type:complete